MENTGSLAVIREAAFRTKEHRSKLTIQYF